MNIKMVFKVIGRLLIFVALLMLLPAAVGLYYREEWNTIGAFLLSAGLGLGAGALLNLQKVPIRSFFTREGLVIVSLSWLLISFLGGLPLYLSGQYPTLVDAFLKSVPALPPPVQRLRSMLRAYLSPSCFGAP